MNPAFTTQVPRGGYAWWYLDALSDDEWVAHFGRFEPLPGQLSAPLAMRYHGHQFRVYNPDLGDGRGFTFAQMREAGTGRLLELGTKGSGTTPWSRAVLMAELEKPVHLDMQVKVGDAERHVLAILQN